MRDEVVVSRKLYENKVKADKSEMTASEWVGQRHSEGDGDGAVLVDRRVRSVIAERGRNADQSHHSAPLIVRQHRFGRPTPFDANEAVTALSKLVQCSSPGRLHPRQDKPPFAYSSFLGWAS